MTYTKTKFKVLVKKACESACFSKLLEEKSEVSKGKEIIYDKFQIQPYLSSGTGLSSESICNILKCRIRDLDVKQNFANAYEDTKCPFSLCISSETQFHLFTCNFYSFQMA